MDQLALGSVLAEAREDTLARVERHVATVAREYRGMAELIAPNLADWREVRARVVFAILSAHATFEAAVAGLRAVESGRPEAIVALGHVPAKVSYLRALPQDGDVLTLTRLPYETWDAHRERLRLTVPGLGRCKATFATCLLEPTIADVACVDTHIARLYLGQRAAPSDRDRATYLAVEDRIRGTARLHGLSTFAAQWAIWDYVRGTRTDHDIWRQ